MRNRMAFEKYSKNVLIVFFVLLIDVLILFSYLFASYNKSLSNHKGDYNCEELFSVGNSEYELYDIYKAYKSIKYGTTDEEVPVLKLFEKASFSVVSQPMAEAVLINYKGDHNLALFDLGYYFNFDKITYNEEQLSVLLNNTGFLISGTLFLYRDNLYLYGAFNDEPIEPSEKSAIKNLKESLAFCKTSKCLFKVEGIDSNYILENFYTEKWGNRRLFPSWYNDIEAYPIIKVLLIILFVVQFPIAIKKGHKNTKRIQSGDGTMID